MWFIFSNKNFTSLCKQENQKLKKPFTVKYFVNIKLDKKNEHSYPTNKPKNWKRKNKKEEIVKDVFEEGNNKIDGAVKILNLLSKKHFWNANFDQWASKQTSFKSKLSKKLL